MSSGAELVEARFRLRQAQALPYITCIVIKLLGFFAFVVANLLTMPPYFISSEPLNS